MAKMVGALILLALALVALKVAVGVLGMALKFAIVGGLVLGLLGLARLAFSRRQG